MMKSIFILFFISLVFIIFSSGNILAAEKMASRRGCIFFGSTADDIKKYKARQEKLQNKLYKDLEGWGEEGPFESTSIGIVQKYISDGLDLSVIDDKFLSNVLRCHEQRLALFLVYKGIDGIDKTSLKYVTDLGLAKLLIRRGIAVKDGLLYASTVTPAEKVYNWVLLGNQNLALLYYKYGASSAVKDETGRNPITRLLQGTQLKKDFSPEDLRELLTCFIGMGVPVNVRDEAVVLASYQAYPAYCGSISKTIRDAQKKNVQAVVMRKKMLPAVLDLHMIKDLWHIVLEYDDPKDHIVPFDIVNKMEEIDRKADLDLEKSLKEVEKIAEQSMCVIL